MPSNAERFRRLETRRFEARITVEDLAKEAASHAPMYYRWRTPEGPIPTAPSLDHWGAALDRLIDRQIDTLTLQLATLRKIRNKGTPRPRDGQEPSDGNRTAPERRGREAQAP